MLGHREKKRRKGAGLVGQFFFFVFLWIRVLGGLRAGVQPKFSFIFSCVCIA